MLMSSHTLSGTGAYQEIQHVLAACAATSLIVVGGGLAAVAKKQKQGSEALTAQEFRVFVQ